MKLTSIVRMGFLVAGLTGAFGLIAAEDPPPEHVQLMRDIGAASGAIRKGVEPAVNGQKLADLADTLGAWWAKRNSEPATKAAKDLKAAALQVVEAAKANNAEGVTAAAKLIQASCMGCHSVHREQGPGGNKIK